MHRHAYLGTLLALVSCLSAKDHALFESGSDIAAGASAAASGSAAAQSGTDSGSGAQGNVGSGASAGSQNQSGGSGGTEPGPQAGAPGSAGGAPQDDMPHIDDCSMLEGALTSELNAHCYRVNEAELTFADARAACQQAGGHLVTISSAEENDFAAEIHDGEHWIGATDGRPDTMSGTGSYAWVVEEDFSYSDWEEGQPNAFETNCPDQGDESDCFEHCAFQTDEGDWNDRSCWHTIVSICEWDIEPGAGVAAAASPAP